MQFLRTVFWVAVAIIGVLFSVANWGPVRVNLWSPIYLDIQLPILLLIVFLIGLIPPWLLHRITRWNLNRKLDAANRSLSETRGLGEPPLYDSMPPGAAPIAPPPGIA